MTVTTRRDRWRAAANERIRQVLAVRRAAAAGVATVAAHSSLPPAPKAGRR